jgi:hypothetical protein
MRKPNIRFNETTLSVNDSRQFRSMSPVSDFRASNFRATYDNINLANHLPFADKSQPDILKNDERFKTFY